MEIQLLYDVALYEIKDQYNCSEITMNSPQEFERYNEG